MEGDRGAGEMNFGCRKKFPNLGNETSSIKNNCSTIQYNGNPVD